ncbi:MAG TPA: hypothetical protein VN249_01835 [Prolixibacteraceae bacterium]|nr:hypothetical protein [Prolixibacteraceae bacterium]
MKRYRWIIGLFLLLAFGDIHAQNPILKGYADPHMKVWNGKMYISVGKDKSPDIKGFICHIGASVLLPIF